MKYKVLGHFCISGAFSNSHKSNPSPHPANNIGLVYPESFRVSTLYRVGGGRTARHFRKGCTDLRGNQEMNIAVLSNRNVYYIPYPLLLQPVAANFTASSRSSSCLIESGKPRRMISYTKLHNTNFNSDFCYIHFIVISQFSHLHSGLSQNRSLARGTENIFSEDNLRSRIFGSFVVKFLARLPLLGFSNI